MNRAQREIAPYLFEDIYRVGDSDLDQVAVVYNQQSYTYREMGMYVDYLCGEFSKMGVKKGDHVALLSTNGFNWLCSFFAIVRLGGVAVLVNYILRHDDLVHAISFTDCKYIVHGKFIAEGRDPDAFLKLLVSTGVSPKETYSIRDSTVDCKKVLANGAPESFPAPYPREDDSKRTSHIVFTTGTTSQPKAVMLNQYGILNSIYHNLYRLTTPETQSFLCLLPLFHCFGLLTTLGYLCFGYPVHLNSMIDAKDIYMQFVKERCSDYASVAIIFDKLARAPFFRLLRNGRFVSRCIVGGGFTSEKEFAFLEKRYGKNKFLNGYGQSECSPLISLVYPGAPREKQRETVGVPIEGIEIKTFDSQKNEVQSPDKIGEILIKGYVTCNGYYKFPEESQPIDKDGYLHTGDLGYIDKDGYLRLSGRKKDIIIRKGENISPAEIEAKFAPYKEFSRVRVMGFPSLTDGENVIAIVELKKKPLHFHESYYIKELHAVLPSIKIPMHIVYFPEFPLTANGKLDERKLREWTLDKLDRIVDRKAAAEARKIAKQLNKD